MSLRSEEEGDSVVTVGSRPTLPTFYVDTHEGGGQTTQESQPGHLRFRNRSADSAVFDSSRSSPSYGTPGSSSLNFVSPADSG